MKFKVTEREIGLDGAERIKQVYEVTANEMNAAHLKLQQKIYSGIICGYSIVPVGDWKSEMTAFRTGRQEVQNDER